VVEVDNDGHPMFFAFPNIDHYATTASSVKVIGWESVHNPMGIHTNCELCSILSSLGLHSNKNLEHSHNIPSLDHNNVSDTNDLPIDTTTSHSRKISQYQYQEQHTHRPYQVSLPHAEVPQIQWVAEGNLSLYLPGPYFEEEPWLPTPKALFQRVSFSIYCLLPPIIFHKYYSAL
jgi:hypothetical protein